MTNENATVSPDETQTANVPARTQEPLGVKILAWVALVLAIASLGYSIYTMINVQNARNAVEEARTAVSAALDGAEYTEHMVGVYDVEVGADGNLVAEDGQTYMQVKGYYVYTDDPSKTPNGESGTVEGSVTYYPLHMYED